MPPRYAFAAGALPLHRGASHADHPQSRLISKLRTATLWSSREMTVTPETVTTLIPGAHRTIRVLAAGEGPWSGVLVADGDEHAVWHEIREDDELDWRFVDAEHVAAPLDVARRPDGHGALLPWCTMRVSVFLTRRTLADAPLDPGEWVTLVASLLRGVREIVERAGEDAPGEWWLTQDGRPLCVPAGAGNARAAAGEILLLAEAGCRERGLRRLIGGVGASIAETTPTKARIAAWEKELFAYAAARPLRMDVHPPASARGGSADDIRALAPHEQRRRIHRSRERRPSAVRELLGSIDGHVQGIRERWGATRRSMVRTSSGSSGPAPKRSRTRIAVVAGAVSAVVLTAGLLWPTETPPPAAGSGQVLPASAESAVAPLMPAPAPEPSTVSPTPHPESPAPDAEASDSDDPLGAMVQLLDTLDACAASEDAACAGAISSGSSAVPEAILRSGDAGSAALVDDYGDLAVIRIGAAGEQQMLVLIRQNEKWLVRDAYDVADQPEKG